METIDGTAKMKSDVGGSLHVAGLCWVAILFSACSVDIDKLRAPSSAAPDTAVDPSAGGAGDACGASADISPGPSGVDSAAASSDLPGAEALAGREDVIDLPSQDAVGDAAALGVFPDSSDLPQPSWGFNPSQAKHCGTVLLNERFSPGSRSTTPCLWNSPYGRTSRL
jgi:hypothetical protein